MMSNTGPKVRSSRTTAIALPLVVILLTAILALPLACAKKEAEVIKIGAVLPLTGNAAAYGEAAKRGIELAIENINSSGGVDGLPIEIVYEDTQADPKVGVSAARKLITVDKVPAIIGGLASSVTLAVAPLADQHSTVLLSPASSAPQITYAGDYVFRNCASDNLEGSELANFAYETLKSRRVAVLFINNDYGTGIKDVFEDEFLSYGGSVVLAEFFDQGASDFRSLLAKAKSVGPEAVLIVGYKELGQLLKQSKEIGLVSQFLSTVMFEDPDILDLSADAAEGVIYTTRSYDPSGQEEATMNFVTEYRRVYEQTPDIFAALAYDAASLIALAMENGGISAKGIKQSLYKIKNFQGAPGEISFDENGDVIRPAILKTVRHGAFVQYEPRQGGGSQ